MKTSHFTTLWGLLALLLVSLLAASCSEYQDEPIADDDSEYEMEMTPAQVAHSVLLGNFYTKAETLEPRKGIAIDESKPSERSEACESFELALKDFGRYLPSNDGDEQFITRNGNAISVDLGELGSVKFAAATGEGFVARIDISLKDAPEYTVLYRHEDSFGDNFGSDQNLYEYFYPGDMVSYVCPCPVVRAKKSLSNGDDPGWEWYLCCKRELGIVVEVSTHFLYIFSDHRHQYKLKDFWKGYTTFDYHSPSVDNWKKIYYSWHANKSAFMDTYYNNNNDDQTDINALYNLMEDGGGKDYVCVDGDDCNLDTYTYWAHKTWYSKAKRIKKSNLRRGDFSVETVDYAYRNTRKNINCDYYMFLTLDKNWASAVRKIYPKY